MGVLPPFVRQAHEKKLVAQYADSLPEGVKIIDLGYRPRPFQAQIHTKLRRFNVLVCHRRFGKCHPASTLVPTPEGFKKINEIEENSFVMSSEGAPTRVLSLYDGGEKEIYKVTFENGQEVETDAGHLWYVEPSFAKVGKRANRKPWACGTLKTTKELIDSAETLFIPIVQTEFVETALPIAPWLFGYWLGNGSKSEMSITASYEDDHLFSSYSSKKDYGGGCFRYHYLNHKQKLRDLGVLGNKHIPHKYLMGSVVQRTQLLQGLMDSDGTVSSSGTCRFDNKNERLIADVMVLISSLGMIPYKHFYLREKDGVKEKEFYILFTARNTEPFTLERKQKKVRISNRPLRHKIVKVEKTDKKENVYCFQVEAENNLFLVSESFIPTHNTVLSKSEIADKSLSCPYHNPQYAYIAPTYTQAERVAWQYFKDSFKNLPGFTSNEQKLRITFQRSDRGDIVTVMLLGADNPDSIRGIYLDGVVLDEYAQFDPRLFGEVIRPLLADRKGWAIFIGTPKGQNHFYDMYTHALEQMHTEGSSWYTCVYRASHTKVVDAEELHEAKISMSREQYEQEFECSFTAALIGAYYGEPIAAIETKGQVKDFLHDPQLTVTTAWDLGVDDSTAIWFVQTVGSEMRIIDYYECNGKGADHYVQYLKSLPYTYEEHLLPHDAAAREFGSGRTREETFRTLGLTSVRICPRDTIEDGINAVRLLLPKCWFNLRKTARGLTALKNFQRKWDGKAKMYMNKPLHDWSSHGSDAFRTLALNLRGGSKAKRFQDLRKYSTYE